MRRQLSPKPNWSALPVRGEIDTAKAFKPAPDFFPNIEGQNVNMSRNSISHLIAVAAWISITVIAYATLTHVGFVYAIYFKLSPILMGAAMRNYAHFEHIIAFVLVGVLFSFAYPRRTVLVCCIVFGGAALLEILQTLTPDRHGTLVDALEKMAGGAAGIFLTRYTLQLAGRYRISKDRAGDCHPSGMN